MSSATMPTQEEIAALDNEPIIEDAPEEGAETPAEEPIGEIVDQPAEKPHVEEEPEADEPVADPRDQIIANYEKLLSFQTQGQRPAEEPKADDTLRAKIAEIGFGSVPGVDADGNATRLDWSGGMAKFADLVEQRATAKIEAILAERLGPIQQTLGSTRYEAAIAKNGIAAEQRAAFEKFAAKQYATDPTLSVLRDRGAPEHAVEIIRSRFEKRKQEKIIAKGEERRQQRLSGAALQSGAPRGGNSAGPTLKIKMSDPDFGNKIDQFVARGGDPKNLKVVR